MDPEAAERPGRSASYDSVCHLKLPDSSVGLRVIQIDRHQPTPPCDPIYAEDYIAYLQQVNAAGKLVPNSTFATPPATSKDSFLVTNAPNGDTRFGDPRTFATWNFTDAGGRPRAPCRSLPAANSSRSPSTYG
jgi:hypothetical protein